MNGYAVEEVLSGAGFDAAYAMLDAQFGPRGELERKHVLAAWVAAGAREVAGLRIRYHLLVARDAAGAVAGVRDCYVTCDDARRVCVVYLAHVLVLPPYRRTGLARQLRDFPVELARAQMAPDSELVLAAEMEHADERPETRVRLLAYGRDGFAAIPWDVLPYHQPDFRDLDALGAAPEPLPLLLVVKHVGHEARGWLPAPLAAACVEHLYAVFSTHCRPADLEAPRRRALDTLAASGLSRVPLHGLSDLARTEAR
jgi:GNAT superfamily N-acetyltransferase